MKISVDVDEVSIVEQVQNMTTKQVQDEIAKRTKKKLIEQMSTAISTRVMDSLYETSGHFSEDSLRKEAVQEVKDKLFTEKFKTDMIKKILDSGEFLEALEVDLLEMLQENIKQYRLSLDFVPKSGKKNKTTGGKK